jgi:hypothetical protein
VDLAGADQQIDARQDVPPVTPQAERLGVEEGGLETGSGPSARDATDAHPSNPFDE